MSLSSRPNLLRAAVQSRALWLAVPAIAALILFAFLGHWAVNTPAPISVAEAEPAAQAGHRAGQGAGSDERARGGEGARVHQVHRRPEERDRADRQKLSRRQPRDLRRHPERTRREDGEGADREAQGRHLAELRRNLSRAQRLRRRQPRRRHHRRRVLRLQLRLLQARPARRREARRDRPQGARGVQGVADPVEGLRGGFPRRARRAAGRASTGSSTRPCSGPRAR